MKKIGLVLSGGGARGFAHLGLLKALDELGVKPYAISGVSVGAILGALYAQGKSTEEILALTKGSSYFGFSNFLWRKAGFFSMEAIRQLLLENIPHNSFEDLKLPLFVNATDFTHNKPYSFQAANWFLVLLLRRQCQCFLILLKWKAIHSLMARYSTICRLSR